MNLPIRLPGILAISLSFGALAADPPFDLVLRNARIVDGTGSPWFRGDVAIRVSMRKALSTWW